MSKKRRSCYVPKRYESVGNTFIDSQGRKRNESNLQIYESMLVSEAFMDLKARQKVLYVCVKAQLYGHRKPKQDYKDVEGFDREDLIYFSWKAAQEYGLYTKTMQSNFSKDMRVLVNHGFLKVYVEGSIHKTKNVYLLSDEWQTWKKRQAIL